MDICLSEAVDDMSHEYEQWLHDMWSHEDTINEARREAAREAAREEGNE